MQKGQITIFMILGIVLLAGAGFFFFSSGAKDVSPASKVSSDPLENYIGKCAERLSREALLMAGIEGGTIDAREYVIFFGGKTPYYFGTQNSRVPEIAEVESYLSGYVAEKLPSCVDLSTFPDYDVEAGEPSVAATVGDLSVLFKIDYPLRITKEGAAKTVSDFSQREKSRIKLMHDVARRYIIEQAKNPKYIGMSDLVILGRESNLLIETNSLGKTVAFTIIDNSTKLDGKEYRYAFAVSYQEG